jgi:hypothetical protein
MHEHFSRKLRSEYLRIDGRILTVKLSLCFTNQALHHEVIWWSGCIDPRILDFGAQLHAPAVFPRGNSPNTN